MNINLNAILKDNFDIFEDIVIELNKFQSCFKFVLIDGMSMISDKDSLGLTEIFRISHKIKKKKDINFLLTITDKVITLPESVESCNTYIGISPGLATIHWKPNNSKFVLIRDIISISIQKAINSYLECNHETCLFSSKSTRSLKFICDDCKYVINKQDNKSIDMVTIGKCITSVNRQERMELTRTTRSHAFLSGIRDEDHISEISDVIVLEIIGYSTLTETEQKKQILKLQETIKDNELMIEYFEEIIFLPTGNGCILSMFGKIARKAINIVISLQQDIIEQRLLVRFGINFGSVFQYEDINGNPSVAGSGVNLAARAMQFGDANHIIATRTVYNYFGNLDRWHKNLFTSLGKVKIGENGELEIFNINSEREQIGNSNSPKMLKNMEKI
jgi:hypothetical protein